MYLTQKQKKILKAVAEGNADGTAIDITQLSETLDYKPSKESLQFSIRAMIGHNLIRKGEKELRRERFQRVILPTGYGKQLYEQLFKPTSSPSFSVPDSIDLYEDFE